MLKRRKIISVQNYPQTYALDRAVMHDMSTPYEVHCFFPRLFKGFKKKTFELSRVKLYRNDLRGNKNYFESAGGSSYRG